MFSAVIALLAASAAAHPEYVALLPVRLRGGGLRERLFSR
jgi:hypothetical protein